MKSRERINVGRLALRVEGHWWAAYWAPELTTMQGAVKLATIRLNIARNEEVKEIFMRTARLAFSNIVKEVTGQDIIKWNEPEVAPESERSGNA